MSKVKVATIQMNNRIELYELKEKVFNRIKQAYQEGVKIICFPELTFSKLNVLDVEEDAEFLNGSIVTWLSELAIKYNINIVAGLVEKNEHYELFNTAVFIDSIGKIVSFHRKNVLNHYEESFMTSGDEFKCFETEYGKVAIIIGNDILSYKILQEILKNSPILVFVLAQIPEYCFYSFKACLISCVLECPSIFIVSTNIGYHEVARMNFTGLSAVMCNPLLMGGEDAQTESDLFMIEITNKERLLIKDIDVDRYNRYSDMVGTIC